MSDCIFCKIINGEIPSEKIYEDEEVLAFLDINPYTSGHTLVLAKEHYENMEDIPKETLRKLMDTVKKISPAIKEGVESKGFNVGINNGDVAGQEIPHLHIHIIPRFEEDNLEHWPQSSYQQGEIKYIAEAIRVKL